MTRVARLAAFVKALDEAVADLERYAREVTFDRFVSDRDAFRMVCNALYVAAQATLDIAEILVAERRLGPPSTYRETIALLANAGVLDSALAKDLSDWVGLRNVLAHVYTTLDLAVLHQAYVSGLQPLKRWREIAASGLDSGEPSA